MSNYQQFYEFTNASRHLQDYFSVFGIKTPLLSVLETQNDCKGQQQIMDVQYETYSIHVNYPNPILEVQYSGVHYDFGDGRVDVGTMWVRLELGSVGRILMERIICTEVHKVEYLQKIDERI